MKAVHLPAHEAFLRHLEIRGADPPLLWLHGWQCTSLRAIDESRLYPKPAKRLCDVSGGSART
jgi:hypothetical protein